MTMPSTFLIFQFSVVALLLTTIMVIQKTSDHNLLKKRFINIAIRGGSTNTGDGRLWAIPYRFGKRSTSS